MKSMTLDVHGMLTMHCARVVEGALRKVPGFAGPMPTP